MEIPNKSYYGLIVDLNAPVNSRSSVFYLALSSIHEFYEGKPVQDYFWRFEQIFRKYSNYETLVSQVEGTGLAVFSSNRPITSFTNPFNPNQHLHLVIAKDQAFLDQIKAKLGL